MMRYFQFDFERNTNFSVIIFRRYDIAMNTKVKTTTVPMTVGSNDKIFKMRDIA